MGAVYNIASQLHQNKKLISEYNTVSDHVDK